MTARPLVLALLTAACTGPRDPSPIDPADGAEALFDVDGAFWEAPFPSDHRVREDTRRVDLSAFPNPNDAGIVRNLLSLLDGTAQGFAVSGVISVPFAGAVDPTRLPTLLGSLEEDAEVFLMDVTDAADAGQRWPIDVGVRDLVSVYAPAHAVVALPVQGVPLPSRRRMALVVYRTLRDTTGELLATSRPVEALVAGDTPNGWRDDVVEQYRGALDVLGEQGVNLARIAGLTVFTTGDPLRDMDGIRATVEASSLRIAGSLVGPTVYDDYCAYELEVAVPHFQHGTPPFATEGGGFQFEPDGELIASPDLPELEARLFVTVPRVAAAAGAFPTVVFVRTGGGGDVPLVNRSVHGEDGADVAGAGYAADFARHGWAGVQLDGPLGGPLRNPDGADEQFLVFNVNNPLALRDTLRQSALELAILPSFVRSFRLDNSGGACPGVGAAPRLGTEHLALFGHSMGATIAPFAAALQPDYDALILSGAGGSWIENIVHKQAPVNVRPLAASMIGETEEQLDAFHPVLSLLQWAGEPADPPIVADRLVRSVPEGEDARHVLMFQGLLDTYIPPPVANPMTLALGLDRAGDVLDTDFPYRPLADVMPLRGLNDRPLPAGLNVVVDELDTVTAVVVQHAEDGLENGHEVAYQLGAARHQVGCFLEGLVADVPIVAAPGDVGGPCPEPPGDAE